MEQRIIKNPIFPGWYADPEARFYEGRYWIYVTRSATDYYQQLNLDAYSSSDLVHWEKHTSILNMDTFPWVTKAVWAPTIIDKDGKYYLIFAANDIHSNDEPGGLAIAVSSSPGGPFCNLLERPLIDCFINKAQPIDAHLFKDGETIYLYYGGWGHCNVCIMNDTMSGWKEFEDGTIFKEITPAGYVEGPCMLKRKGAYYFMWSEGNWMDGSYRVRAARSDSPVAIGPAIHTLLEKDTRVADGPGHHGYLQIENTDNWLIVYHRRYLTDKEPGHRFVCMDRLIFDENDHLLPVSMTCEWVLE